MHFGKFLIRTGMFNPIQVGAAAIAQSTASHSKTCFTTPKMFALVRFLNEYTKETYEVSVDEIKDFHPADENDFDRGKVYILHPGKTKKCKKTRGYTRRRCCCWQVIANLSLWSVLLVLLLSSVRFVSRCSKT